ncbi:MAG TPA: hypothetical protein VK791_08675, partial [bacterium]|nr:hypothetical protein [bacterium]
MRLSLLLILGMWLGMSIQAGAANTVKAPVVAAPVTKAAPAPAAPAAAAPVVSAPAKSAPIALAVAATATFTPVTQSTWRVHAGTAYTDSQGNIWSADRNFT